MRLFQKIGLILITTIILSFSIVSQAQNEGNYWVYQKIETDEAYEIIRINALDNTNETITTIPKTPDFTLRSIMPEEELAAAEEWSTGSISSPVGSGIPDYFEGSLDVLLRQIIPSPDGTQVALVIYYRRCFHITRSECFGVNQVVLVSSESTEQQILLALPVQGNSPFYGYCDPQFQYIDSFSVDTSIQEIRWLPDQSGIVAMIRYHTSYAINPNNPLIVIPLNSPESAFIAGSSKRGWAISPDSQSIASISSDCDSPTSQTNIVRVTSFDLDTNQVSYQDFSQTPEIAYLGMLYGIAFFQNQLVFRVEETNPYAGATGPIYSWARLNPTQENSIRLLGDSFISDTFGNMRSSLSGEVLLGEDRDGLLWRFELHADDYALIPVTTTPVSYWHFANDEELVVQFEGDTDYSIISIENGTS